MKLAWLFFAIALSTAPAFAHSWYPWECCSSQDCWPMGEDSDAKEPEPKVVPGGYMLHDGEFIAERDTRPSRDGRFHICRKEGAATGNVIWPDRQPLCMWTPRPNS